MLVVCRLAPTLLGIAGLLLNSHSHKKMFVTVTSSTVRPMAFSTKTYEILIYSTSSLLAHFGGRSLQPFTPPSTPVRMRDNCEVAGLTEPVTVWEEILLY